MTDQNPTAGHPVSDHLKGQIAQAEGPNSGIQGAMGEIRQTLAGFGVTGHAQSYQDDPFYNQVSANLHAWTQNQDPQRCAQIIGQAVGDWASRTGGPQLGIQVMDQLSLVLSGTGSLVQQPEGQVA